MVLISDEDLRALLLKARQQIKDGGPCHHLDWRKLEVALKELEDARWLARRVKLELLSRPARHS